MPACGVNPEAMANAIASGKATRPTVIPAITSWANLLRLKSRKQRTDFESHRSSGKANAIVTSCQVDRFGARKTASVEHPKEHVRESMARDRAVYHDSIRTPKATSDAAPQRRHVTFSFNTYFASRVSRR